MLITCWLLFEYGQGFLKQFRPRAPAACHEDSTEKEEETEPIITPPSSSSTSNNNIPMSHQPAPSSNITAVSHSVPPLKPASVNGQVLSKAETPDGAKQAVDAAVVEEAGHRYRPSEGLPEHTPNRPEEGRPKSGKVLKRKNTPALLPKVEKLYAKEKASHNNPMLCEEEDEEEEEEEEQQGACGGGH